MVLCGMLQVGVLVWGDVALEYVSPAACPAAVGNPLWALALHWLYLTVADWCTEQCADCSYKRMPQSSLPLLPRYVWNGFPSFVSPGPIQPFQLPVRHLWVCSYVS